MSPTAPTSLSAYQGGSGNTSPTASLAALSVSEEDKAQARGLAPSGGSAGTDEKGAALLPASGAAAGAGADSNPDLEASEEEQIRLAAREGIQPVFYAKVLVLNRALQEIGMGRYQWELFMSSGFGWFADNIWLQTIAIVMPAVANEFMPFPYARLATLALYAGMICGATFWGMSCDVVGRRIAWNCTLFISGVFGFGAAAAPNWIVFCTFIAFIGFGAGGNLPVDGTMFLEFLPGDKQYLLTFLSVWWSVGQCFASLVAWAFISRYGCETPAPGEFCAKADNMGWRYTYYTLSAVIVFCWIIRFFVLPVYESPKFLAFAGRDEEAVEVIHKIAKRNGKTINLSVSDLTNAAAPYLTPADKARAAAHVGMTPLQRLRMAANEMSIGAIKTLFYTRRLAINSGLIIFCYAALGLGFPLYNSFLGGYLQVKMGSVGNDSVNATYSAYAYQAACGIPGSAAAALLVNWSRGGRKFAMGFFTIMAGVFLFALTQASTPAMVNGLTCAGSFFQMAFYGVLYGYAPEVFPTPARGTGDAFCAAASRITGIFAPVIAVYSPVANEPEAPVFVAASIFIFTGITMFFLPIETQGKTAL